MYPRNLRSWARKKRRSKRKGEVCSGWKEMAQLRPSITWRTRLWSLRNIKTSCSSISRHWNNRLLPKEELTTRLVPRRTWDAGSSNRLSLIRWLHKSISWKPRKQVWRVHSSKNSFFLPWLKVVPKLGSSSKSWTWMKLKQWCKTLKTKKTMG